MHRASAVDRTATSRIAPRILVPLLAIWPAVLVVLATGHGIGISIDSVSYLATAQSIVDGNGVTNFDAQALTIFPPGYPLLLGLVMLPGLSSSTAALLVSVVAVVAIVVLAYVLALEITSSAWFAILVTAFVSLSSATVFVHSYAWSEAPFTVAMLAVLVLLTRAISAGSASWRLIGAIALLASIACTMRYVGVVLIPVVGLAVWWGTKSSVRTLIATGVSSAGFLLVCARNLSLGAGPFGERYPGSRTVEGAINALVDVLGGYVAPPQSTGLTALVGAFVVLVIAIGAWRGFLERDRAVVLLGVLLVGYWLVVVYGQTAARLDDMSARLAAPVFVPTVILAALGVRSVGRSLLRQVTDHQVMQASIARRAGRVVGLVVLSLVIGLSVLHSVRFVESARRDGLGYNAVAMRTTPVSRAAFAVDPRFGIASNDPWQVWWARQGGVSVQLPVSPTEWPIERVERDLERFTQAIKNRQVQVVLIANEGEKTLTLDEFADAGLMLTDQEDLAGVTRYRVTVED